MQPVARSKDPNTVVRFPGERRSQPAIDTKWNGPPNVRFIGNAPPLINTETATSSRTGALPRWLLACAIAFSLGIHAAVVLALMPRVSDEQFGTLADKSDAISLSTTQTIVLESIVTETAQIAAAAAAASQAGGVQSVESAPQELTEVKDVPKADEPPPKPLKVADLTPTALAHTDEPLPVIRGGGTPDAASEVKAQEIAEKPEDAMPEAVETKEDEAEKVDRKEETKKEREKTEQEQSHQQMAGSTTSRSSTSEAAVNGHVSASRGNALSYAASVRAQVARNKPSGSGLRGTARVSFGISETGDLAYLRLTESSGYPSLDDAALACVRRAAPFGPPPGDVARAELAFSIPFFFR